MRRATAIAIVAASLVSALAAALAWFGLSQRAAATAPRPVWTEVAWPFPIDQWGKGKAFRCKAADCGAEVNDLSACQARLLQLHDRRGR